MKCEAIVGEVELGQVPRKLTVVCSGGRGGEGRGGEGRGGEGRGGEGRGGEGQARTVVVRSLRV